MKKQIHAILILVYFWSLFFTAQPLGATLADHQPPKFSDGLAVKFLKTAAPNASDNELALINLANSEVISWRNGSNSANESIWLDSSSIFQMTKALRVWEDARAEYFRSFDITSAATSGVFRLANTESINWLNAAGLANKGLTLDASDVFQLTSALNITGALTVTSTPTFSSLGTGIGHLSSGGILTSSAVNLGSADVTGTNTVPTGGTGAVTLTAHGVLLGQGTSAITALAAAGAGSILQGVAASDPAFTRTPVLGLAGTATGTLGFSGTTSGTVTVQPQSAAGTYNFNLPTTAGSSGQVLASGGGGSSAMTWVSALTNPMASTGDIIYASDQTGSASRLAFGTSGQFLKSNGNAAPSWAAALSNPMASTGDMIYSSDQTGTAAKLAFGTADQTLESQGNAAPTWSTTSESFTIRNVGIGTSVGSSALTISLKQGDGSTNCSTGGAACKIGMRSSTAATGGYSQRSVTGALSVVVSSGSTLGWASAAATYAYVYAIDNSGTVELAVSSSYFDCGSVVSTTAEGGAGAADSNAVMYSTTARTGVACRLIGRFKATEATAGTWATAPSEVSLIPNDVIFPKAVYQTSAGQSIANTNTDTIVNFGTVVIDNCNCVTVGASWKFTVPATGKYAISSSILYDAAAWVVGNDAGLALYANGSKVVNLIFNGATPTGTDYVGLSGSTLYAFTAGDTVDIRTKHNRTAGAATLETTQSSNTVSIWWVGP